MRKFIIFRRRWRQTWPVFGERLKAPIHETNLILALLPAPITLMFYQWIFGAQRMKEELGIFVIGTLAFLGSYFAYAVVSLVSAPFIAAKREKERGGRHGDKFVYHIPLYIQTILIEPKDDLKWITIKINDAEPDAFVYFKFEFDKGKGFLSIGPMQGREHTEQIRKIEYGLRLDRNRGASFQVNCPVNSDPTIARVYVLYWVCDNRRIPATIDQRPLR